MKDYDSYFLHFHDLTCTEDSGTRDQAVSTIGETNKIPSLKVKNQDLKSLFSDIAGLTQTCSVLTVENISDWHNVRLIVDKLAPKRFQLCLNGTVSCIRKRLPQLQSVMPNLITIQYPDLDTFTTHRRALRTGESLSVPRGVSRVEIRTEVEGKAVIAAIDPILSEAQCTFSIGIHDVNRDAIEDQWDSTLKNFSYNSVSFSCSSKSQSVTMVEKLREKHIDFLLVFEDLSHDEAEFILQRSDKSQEDIKQTEMKEMREKFTSSFVPLDELKELAERGFHLVVSFQECAPIPWRTVTTIALIATVQTVAGAAFVCTGFGVTLGIGLIMEGMSDYLTAGTVMSSAHFSYADWAVQKAVSLAISFITMGWGALKNGAKAVSVAKSASKQTIKAGASLSLKGETVSQTVKISSKNLKVLVCKQICVQAGETASRAGLNSLMDTLVEFTFEQVKSQITEAVEREVSKAFRAREFSEALSSFYAVHSASNSPKMAHKFAVWVAQVTNPESNIALYILDKITLPLCKGILSDRKYLGSKFSMAIRAQAMIRGMYEIATVVGKVCDHIKVNVQSEINAATPARIIQSHFGITITDAECIVKMMSFDGLESIFTVKTLPPESRLQPYKVDCSQLHKMLTEMNTAKLKFTLKSYEMSRCMKNVTDSLTAHIINTADSQLISPVMTAAVGKIVAEISQQIPSSLVVSDKHMAHDQRWAMELAQKADSDLTTQERQFLASQGQNKPRTVADQIQANAVDHQLAYSQRDILSRIDTLETTNKSDMDIHTYHQKYLRRLQILLTVYWKANQQILLLCSYSQS